LKIYQGLAMIILLIAASSTATVSAASHPVLVGWDDEDGYKCMSYEPDNLELVNGDIVTLDDITVNDGLWFVPEDKNLEIQIAAYGRFHV